MPTWNSRGLRGSTLEDLLNRTNEKYAQNGLALIQKIPTPITPINIDKETRHITLAYFDKVSTVDYIGAVHEDEPANGEELVNILLNKGDRNIGLIGWEQGDATWLGRWEGYKAGVDKWNEEHPDDQAKLSEPQYAGTTSEGGSKAAEALMAADPNLDALIPAGGGGDPLQGAIAAVERAGKTADIDIVSTDFLPDLGDRLENGSMAGESGGHFCDPLIAFMMVYNAVKGNYKDFGGKFEDVPFPYLYVSSADDYKNYEKYFVDQLPYTDQELVDMSKLSLEDLRITAQSVSIEDAAARAGK